MNQIPFRSAIVAAIREAHKNKGHAADIRRIERNLLAVLHYETYADFERGEGSEG